MLKGGVIVYKGLKAEEELYRAVVDLSVKAGMKMILAKINAVLFMEPEEVSLEELAEKTGYSLASVSGAARQLEAFKKATRIKKPGSKRIYYKGEKNFIRMLHDHFKSSIEQGIRPLQEALPYILKDLKSALKDQKIKKEKREELKRKIAWYESYYEQNKIIDELFSKVEKHFQCHEHNYR
jgi:DNA-binding transcriptional regulator GbsR (MarR family)